MKQFILILVVATALLAACNNNNKPTTEPATEKAAADSALLNKQAEEIQMRAEELLKLSSISNDELKALLPASLMATKSSDIQAASLNGTGFASAKYSLNDSTELEVSIWDCGGPGGSGYYQRQAMTMASLEAATEKGDAKIIDFMGQKAIEQCDKNDNRCSLTYFGGKRYWVVIAGHNIHPDGLKQAANDLRL
ncbi:MAG: hypothetical protein JNK14_19635 [Chitinophagaceae bacterium]|nr:hypothetical protein [Chitinophagaceae bacterium]